MLNTVSKANETVTCPCSSRSCENLSCYEPSVESESFSLTVPRRCKESYKSDVRRKIVNKKVLKQARFIYKSKHLSSSSDASALSTHLDNLSLDRSVTTKAQPKVLDSKSITSINTTTNSSCLLTSASSDCGEKSSPFNLKSLKSMPSFCSLKRDNFETSYGQRTLKHLSVDEHRPSNSTVNKIGPSRRRKERARGQSLSDKIEERYKPTRVTSPYTPATSSCAHELRLSETNAAVCEITAYMENYFVLPKKMCSMAEMMYT